MDKTGYIVVTLCVLLLIGWYIFIGMEAPRPEVEEEPPIIETEPEPETEPRAEPRVEPEPRLIEPGPGVRESYPRLPEQRPADEDLVWLYARQKFDLALDATRGGITQIHLRKYFEYAEKDDDDAAEALVELGDWRFPLAALFSGHEIESREVLEKSDNKMVLETGLASGIKVVEEWRLSPDEGYLIDYKIHLKNQAETSLDLTNFLVSAGGMGRSGLKEEGFRMQRVGMMDLGIDYLPAGEAYAERLDLGDIEDMSNSEAEGLARSEVDWLAVHNKYFILFMRPLEEPAAGIQMGYWAEDAGAGNDSPGDEKVYGGIRLPALRLPPGGEKEWEFQVYAGPKEYYRIRELGTDLTSVLGMDFFFFGRARWMGFLSSLILRSLLGLRNLGLSFGLAIVAVTVVIKILFWPLTHKSASSMRKMQKLQPMVKELREKHKSEPQVMNQKVMALYREHKANPLGGCLPMLCQIPVFLALFNTLRSAIELRQSTFLWVADLSQPDTLGFMPFGFPIRPLAILMGASMLLQQKMTPTSADPSQSRMMMIMSIVFIFILYRMPAGLTLYWTINQLLTIAQHGILHRMENAREAAAGNGDQKST